MNWFREQTEILNLFKDILQIKNPTSPSKRVAFVDQIENEDLQEVQDDLKVVLSKTKKTKKANKSLSKNEFIIDECF